MSYFVLERCWNALKRNPGATVAQLAERLDWGKLKTSNALQNLRRRGLAKSEGTGRHNIWHVVGKKPPECMNGLNPRSIANLQITREERMRRLRKAHEALGWSLDVPRQTMGPVFTHELDRCWSQYKSCSKKAA